MTAKPKPFCFYCSQERGEWREGRKHPSCDWCFRLILREDERRERARIAAERAAHPSALPPSSGEWGEFFGDF